MIVDFKSTPLEPLALKARVVQFLAHLRQRRASALAQVVDLEFGTEVVTFDEACGEPLGGAVAEQGVEQRDRTFLPGGGDELLLLRCQAARIRRGRRGEQCRAGNSSGSAD